MPRRAPTHNPLTHLPNSGRLEVLRASTDRTRESSSKRGYDRHWYKLQRAKLSASPFCECPRCSKPQHRARAATVVDHIVSIEQDPTLRLVWSNLRSMAKPCHDAHTARTQGFGKARAKGVQNQGRDVENKFGGGRGSES